MHQRISDWNPKRGKKKKGRWQKDVDNVEEMDKFLEKYNFPKLNQEEIENLFFFFFLHFNKFTLNL